jgi:membrane AbrB-like protein
MLAQAVVGCMMARALPAPIFSELVQDWPIYVIGVGAVVVVAAGLGIVLTRWQVLPGTTAIWGSAPGAASAMTLLADAYGADSRLVAFMAYTRMVMVAVLATVISAVLGGGGHATTELFPPVDATGLVQTVLLAAASLILTRLLQIKAGALILPMVLGTLLQDVAVWRIELPPVVLAVSYVLVGWTIGLRYTRDILAHAARALPAVLGSIVLLLFVCGLFALALVQFAGIDPLTAYLATSPGGADSVAIIAASSKVDVPFVMAMQAGRFMVVLLTGPALARFLATRRFIAER